MSEEIEKAVEHVKSKNGRDVCWDTAMTLVVEIERLREEVEALEILSDPEMVAAIEQARKELADGVEGKTLEELKKELGLDEDERREGDSMAINTKDEDRVDAAMHWVAAANSNGEVYEILDSYHRTLRERIAELEAWQMERVAETQARSLDRFHRSEAENTRRLILSDGTGKLTD